jgi:hypothetical protein
MRAVVRHLLRDLIETTASGTTLRARPALVGLGPRAVVVGRGRDGWSSVPLDHVEAERLHDAAHPLTARPNATSSITAMRRRGPEVATGPAVVVAQSRDGLSDCRPDARERCFYASPRALVATSVPAPIAPRYCTRTWRTETVRAAAAAAAAAPGWGGARGQFALARPP